MLKSHYYEGKIEAGCDEAGRGCLAGSVYAAAVILPENYQNDLLSVILRLIAADGEVGKREVEYLNRNFGFHSTVEEVGAIYRDCCENLGDAFLQNFKNDLDTLCSINKKLFDAYRELLGLICQIIVESDWVVAEEELCEIEKLRKLFS